MPSVAKPRSKTFVNVALDVLTVGCIYMIAQFIAIAVASIGAESDDLLQSPGRVLVLYLISGLIMGGLLFAIMRAYKMGTKSLKLRKLTLGDVGYAITVFLLYLITTIFVGLLLKLIPGIDADQKQDLGLDGVSMTLLPFAFLMLAVLPPLVEEFIFRGFLYTRLRQYRISKFTAAIIVSISFGLVHWQVNVGVDTFILSMFMIYALEKRNNLWVSIVIHALKNTLAFLALFVFKW